ncbi:MAG TPA: hypothetical protein VGC42_03730 [Kofleriaceae bacterium]
MDHPPLTLRVTGQLTAGFGPRLGFAPDGEGWVSAGDGAAHLWRAGETAGDVIAERAATGRVRFSRDGTTLLLAPYSYDLAGGAWLAQAPVLGRLGPPVSEAGLFEAVASAWDADGEDLVVAARFRGAGGLLGATERVFVVRGAERAPIATLYEDEREVRGLAIDDRFIAVAVRDLAIWSRADHRQVAALSGHAVTVTDLAFSPDGRWLASIDGRGVLLVWDTARWGEPVARIQTSAQRALALAWHPRLPVVATGGYDGVVRLWSIAEGERVTAGDPLGGWIQGLAFDPSGGRLVAAANALPARLVVYAVE